MTTEFLTLAPADLDGIHERLDGLSRRLDELGRQNEPPLPRLLLSRSETAETLGCSVSQIDAMRRDGRLPAVYVDGNPRWSVDDLKQFISSRRGAEPTRKRQAKGGVK